VASPEHFGYNFRKGALPREPYLILFPVIIPEEPLP
jgi:hypothetical protein